MSGREVAFPMRDPYGPVVKARIPVPGLTRWPGRRVLGRHYYGMDDAEGAPVVSSSQTTQAATKSFNSESVKLVNGSEDEVCGFAGFADCAEQKPTQGRGLSGWGTGNDSDIYYPDPVISNGGGGGIDWGSIISQGIKAAPAITQAATGGGTPYGYYGSAITQQANIPAGYMRDPATQQLVPIQSARQLAGGLGVGAATVANSLSNFVQQNPMLVLGGGVLLLFLFMKPPGRR